MIYMGGVENIIRRIPCKIYEEGTFQVKSCPNKRTVESTVEAAALLSTYELTIFNGRPIHAIFVCGHEREQRAKSLTKNENTKHTKYVTSLERNANTRQNHLVRT